MHLFFTIKVYKKTEGRTTKEKPLKNLAQENKEKTEEIYSTFCSSMRPLARESVTYAW